MPDQDRDPGDDALVERLDVIEDQPLVSRAAAYAQVHAELSERLERADARRDD